MRGKTLGEMAAILGAPYSSERPISGFAIDSRNIEPGNIFFALKGAKTDGHRYLEQVAKSGAIGAIVSNNYMGPSHGLILFKVEDVLESMHLLAKIYFKKRKEKVIAITGSMGKTTTREFIAEILISKYRVFRSPKNYNSQITFPLNILNLEGEYDYLVLEMAMSKKGHISKLVQIAPPDIAVVTRIAPAGIEDFEGGLKAISEAKGEIFSYPNTQIGVISAQASKFPAIVYGGNARKYIYGWKEDFFDARQGDFVMEEGVYINDSPKIELNTYGRHLQENFLAAASVGRLLGLSWSEIQSKAKTLKPYKYRFEKIEREGATFFVDCYNANPESTKAAIKNLPKPKEGGKVIGVLGRMGDLGKHASYFHKEVGTLAKDHVDEVLCIGREAKDILQAFKQSGKSAEFFEKLEDLRKVLYEKVNPGDVVLIKGSNTLQLWKLLEDALTTD